MRRVIAGRWALHNIDHRPRGALAAPCSSPRLQRARGLAGPPPGAPTWPGIGSRATCSRRARRRATATLNSSGLGSSQVRQGGVLRRCTDDRSCCTATTGRQGQVRCHRAHPPPPAAPLQFRPSHLLPVPLVQLTLCPTRCLHGAGQSMGAPPGGYANGPAPGMRPPGPPGAAPMAPAQLAGQMQQMKLGAAPPGAAVPGMRPPGAAGPPGTAPPGPRPMGPPGAAPGAPLARPGMPLQQQQQQQLQSPTNGYLAGGAAPAGFPQQQQPRPPAAAPGMRPMGAPPGVRPAAGFGVPPGGVRPPGPPGPAGAPAAAAAVRPPGPAGMPHPGMPGPAGGLAPRPPAMGAPGMPGAALPGAAPAVPGFSTPRKDGPQQQQQPHGTPPPYALQMASPSPTKRAGQLGAMPGQPGMPQQGALGALDSSNGCATASLPVSVDGLFACFYPMPAGRLACPNCSCMCRPTPTHARLPAAASGTAPGHAPGAGAHAGAATHAGYGTAWPAAANGWHARQAASDAGKHVAAGHGASHAGRHAAAAAAADADRHGARHGSGRTCSQQD